MIETYQDEQALERAEPQDASFATIGAIYADGVSLIFDGETEPSQKHYKVNAFEVYAANDRVHILKDSGTYVVICKIGNPRTTFAADTANKLTTARNISLGGVLNGSASFDGASNASISASFSAGANVPSANAADKLSTARTISLGGVLSGSNTFDGSANRTITASFASGAMAPIADAVQNQVTSNGDITFMCNAAGVLQFRMGTGSWYTLAKV